MAQPRIGAQRLEERLLEAVLRIGLADRDDQEPMQLSSVVVDQSLKRWLWHTP